MRILRKFSAFISSSLRITPACAGITDLHRSLWISVRDHPRVCGYYYSKNTSLLWCGGSPPRVRVLRDLDYLKEIEDRITPACAGITYPISCQKNMVKDHPRVCGYYDGYSPYEEYMGGSPPRVRVLLGSSKPVITLARITPACAGITKCGL